MPGPYVHCGACGRKGVYATTGDGEWHDLTTIRCRYCQRERSGYLRSGWQLSEEGRLLGLIDTPGDRQTVDWRMKGHSR